MNLNELIEPEKLNMGSIHPRKAVLWGGEDLLSQAVGKFLEVGNTWEVIKLSNDGDLDNLLRMIHLMNPEVVILCQDRINHDSSLPLRLINERLCLRVVTLNLENNSVQVYSKRNLVIQGVEDLLSIIEPEKSSSCTPGKEAEPKNQKL